MTIFFSLSFYLLIALLVLSFFLIILSFLRCFSECFFKYSTFSFVVITFLFFSLKSLSLRASSSFFFCSIWSFLSLVSSSELDENEDSSSPLPELLPEPLLLDDPSSSEEEEEPSDWELEETSCFYFWDDFLRWLYWLVFISSTFFVGVFGKGFAWTKFSFLGGSSLVGTLADCFKLKPLLFYWDPLI